MKMIFCTQNCTFWGSLIILYLTYVLLYQCYPIMITAYLNNHSQECKQDRTSKPRPSETAIQLRNYRAGRLHLDVSLGLTGCERSDTLGQPLQLFQLVFVNTGQLSYRLNNGRIYQQCGFVDEPTSSVGPGRARTGRGRARALRAARLPRSRPPKPFDKHSSSCSCFTCFGKTRIRMKAINLEFKFCTYETS